MLSALCDMSCGAPREGLELDRRVGLGCCFDDTLNVSRTAGLVSGHTRVGCRLLVELWKKTGGVLLPPNFRQVHRMLASSPYILSPVRTSSGVRVDLFLAMVHVRAFSILASA